MFFTIYSKFIQFGYHPLCWRTGLGAVLIKPNKPDYSLPKSYRIITLLNCLGKIAEKIVANRLAYLGENLSLLYTEQMGGRKNHSAIDAVINVVHDIEIANRNKNVLLCLLLDVKGAFFIYLFIKCIQPKVMTINYFKIWFYFMNKSTIYNPTIYRQYCPVFTPC